MNRYETEPGATRDPDQLAIERYRYLLRTAPPETLERAHEEAFERLTPGQRRMVLDGLARESEPAELRGLTDDARDLARLATRTETRRPGTIERVFGGQGAPGGSGAGWGFGGGFLPMLAGAFMGTAIANAMFGGLGGIGGDGTAVEGAPDDPGGRADGGGRDDAGSQGAEGGADGGDAGGGDFGSDFGGDFGDLGGF